MSGHLISFDGTDSSGKATQVGLLIKRLRHIGHSVIRLKTPDYNTDSGRRLKELFQEVNGSWNDLSWDEQNDLFAANRAEHRREVHDQLANSGIVVYDRYVPSSLAHRVIDALAPDEVAAGREAIRQEVASREYEGNNMPRENLSIFLDVPPPIAQQLLEHRQDVQHDAAEMTDSVEYQQRIYEEYQWSTAKHPDRYLKIKCVVDDKLLSPDNISELVWQEVSGRFPDLNHAQ